MLQQVQNLVPEEWSGAFELLSAPVSWIPAWQSAMINFAWYGSSPTEVLVKRVLVMLPMLLLIAAMWSTMVSLYTLPFRSVRGSFLTSMLSAWWDAGRTIWFFWAGMIRVGVVLVGWIKNSIRLAFAILKSAFQSPLNFLDWTSRNYFKPGVPWVAFLGLLVWGVIEALIFTYTLRPTMTEVLAGITGFEPDARYLTPILWVFLYFLILGSFACIQVLGDAMRKRDFGQILQMVLVELSVVWEWINTRFIDSRPLVILGDYWLPVVNAIPRSELHSNPILPTATPDEAALLLVRHLGDPLGLQS